MLAGATPGAIGQTINLGSGREISIGALAQLTGRIIGRPITIETEKERLRPGRSEVERLLCDNSLARKVLGWEPSVSLEDGLQRTLEWLKSNPETYRSGVYAV